MDNRHNTNCFGNFFFQKKYEKDHHPTTTDTRQLPPFTGSRYRLVELEPLWTPPTELTPRLTDVCVPKVDRKDISCGSKCVSGGDGSDGAGSPVVRSPTRWPNKSDKSIRNKHYNSIGVTWLGWLAMRVGSFVVLAITLASKVTVVCVCVCVWEPVSVTTNFDCKSLFH